MNLRAKVALSLAAIVALVIGIAGVGAAVGAADTAERTIDRVLIERIADLRTGDRDAIADILAETRGNGSSRRGYERGRNDSAVRFVTASGQVFGNDFSEKIDATPEEFAIAASRGATLIRSVELGGRRFRMITASIPLSVQDTPLAVQIAQPVEDFDAVRSAVVRQVALFGLLGALTAGAVGWTLVRRLVESIERLTIASERVADTQDLSERIAVDRADEIGRMGQSFNTMLDALDVSRRQQHQLVQDANHELRTPLTSLRTNIEVLQRAKTLPDDEQDRLLSDIGSELGELTTLVEELVASATDVTADTEPIRTVDLANLANDVVERARRRTGRVINLQAEGAADVMAREMMIERAVSNLVNNALKFSPDSFPIDVHVDGARVEVLDRGPGVPPEDLDKIFDRFYRSTEARSQPGSGLGLSIVRQVATNHGGSVWADNRPGGGACIGFEIGTEQLSPNQ